MSSAKSELKTAYETNGFVVVQDLISSDLKSELLAAAERVVDQTRKGQWLHRRTVGSNFPPYTSTNPDSWGVQHLMHTALGEPVFARWYTSDPLIKVATDLLGCNEDDLQMGMWTLTMQSCLR